MSPLFDAAGNEAARARTLFPKADHLVLAFAEEAGEVVKAALDVKQGKGSMEDLQKEMIQCAAMLLRLWEEGDPTLGLPGCVLIGHKGKSLEGFFSCPAAGINPPPTECGACEEDQS